jgi:hypothetical protein
LKVELELVANRYSADDKVKVIYTDNPKSDNAFLHRIFGSHVHVKRDIFHVLNDYFKCCYNHPLRGWFMGEIRNCFFTNDLNDKQSIIDRLSGSAKSRYTREELEAKDEKWFRERVRRYIREEDVILKKLDEVFQRYGIFSGLFKPEIKKKHASIRSQVKKGYITDPKEESIYFNIGTSDKPKFITIRGTSQLESLHYHIQKILDGPNCNEETIHLSLMDRLFRWNRRKGETNKKAVPEYVFDLILQKDVDVLRKKQGLPAQNLTYPENQNPETFGIIRFRHAAESYISSQQVLLENTLHLFPKATYVQKKAF